MSDSLDNFVHDAFQQLDGEDAAVTLAAKPSGAASLGQLPGHEVEDFIARGGMGAVYRAKQSALEREVAVKVMTRNADSPEMAERFRREALVLGKLAHPNIVPVYNIGHDEDGQLYYTMKLVKGRTLQHILNDLRNEDAETLQQHTLASLLTIFRKVCDALAFAHSQGVLHRDLKPENIMVGEFGEVLVMDWGLAKRMNDEVGRMKPDPAAEEDRVSSFILHPSSFTLQGSVMGTPQYMSPEQALGLVDELDARSDIFSLGGILYAILTLRPPVEGKTLEEVLEKVRTGSIASPSAFGATASAEKEQAKGAVLEAKKITPLPHMPGGRVPNALSAVVMKALTLDKTKRYQDIAAFSADIEAFQGGFATTAEQAGLAKQLALLIKRNKGIFTTAAAAWLLITGLAVWFVFNLRAKEQRATQAEVIAVQERETARQALAKSQLDIAEKEFHLGKFVEAQKILGETPESFRDANWHFLQAHSRDYTAQLSIPQKGSANRLQFLPQGDRFAVRCFRDVIGIFTLTGRQIGDWVPVKGLGAFGIDGTGGRLAVAASANEIAVHEVATGKIFRRWICDLGLIEHVLLSPDGGTVLAAGSKQLIAYATETGSPLWTQSYTGVLPAISPDGRTVANLGVQNGLELKIQLIDTLNGTVLRTLETTADNPAKTTLQFNQRGDQLACLGGDEVILWNPKTAMKIRVLHFPGETVKLTSPSGDAVATFIDSRIRLWDTTTGRLLHSFHGASTGTIDVAFSPDGRMLQSSHVSALMGVTHFWPTRLGEEVVSVSENATAARWVAFNLDGSEFYTGVKDSGAWGTRTGLQKWKFPNGVSVARGLAVHPTDGSILLSERDKQSITHLSSAGEVMGAFGPSQFHSGVTFSRNGQLVLWVASATSPTNAGFALTVVEYPTGKALWKISFEKGGQQPFAAFCLDDAAVATAALAGGITVWDWKAGTPLRQIAAAQTGSIACLASSPDGLHLASAGPDRWIRVWEAATGRLEVAFRAHWEGVNCLKFSPDGREILSGSDDGSVRINDAVTGEERLAFYGLNTAVVDLDITADGTLIAAITTDGITKVWDRRISRAAAMLPKVVSAVESVATASPAAKNAPLTGPKPSVPKKPKPVLTKDTEGWEDLLAPLTPAEVEKNGNGWSLKDGELFSPDTNLAMLPLPGEVSVTSYRVRVKLRRVAYKSVLYLNLPIAGRMCGFGLEQAGRYTGLIMVDGKFGKDLPGVVEGKQVTDFEPHVLEVTVRLDGANATITTTLDGKPLYEWTGPTAALSLMKNWATTKPGSLALGTFAGGWVVSEVRVKRLQK